MSLQRARQVALAASAVLATGCATAPGQPENELTSKFRQTFASDDPCSNNARNIGTAGGTLLGLIIGNSIGDGKSGALVAGALMGGLVGGLVGSDMDRRRCEISKVAKAHNLDIVMSDISFTSAVASSPTSAADSTTANTPAATAAVKKPEPAGMSLTIIDHGQQFASGSAKPAEATVKAIGDLADQYLQATDKAQKSVEAAQARNKQMRILLIGHTDDTGSSERNADLSEDRARAIAEIFAKRGFSKDQLFYQGAGEVFPIASNSTEEGRARNRRVEIVDLSDDAAFASFLEARRPNVTHYRPAAETKVRPEVAANAPVAVTKVPNTQKSTTGSAPAKASKITATPSTPSSPTITRAKVPVVVSVPASVAKAAPAPVSTLSNLDLGGKLANGQFRSADIGKTERASSFSIISSAYAAAESPVGSCATDRPRISRGVKSLKSGQLLKTFEYLPGTANASWGGKVNGHMVGLAKVAVLRDGGQPASRPDFFIWKNYVEGSKVAPDMKTNPDVNAYQGDKALLYRVFLTEGPMRCVDLVIPNGAARTAPSSNIVYEHNNALYQADFSPTIIR